MTILISVEELSDRLNSSQPTVLLDVRWALGDPHGHQHYLAGHLPHAVFVDMDHELASHGAPEEGRHPLPAEADFQGAVRRWGIKQGDTVVAYDDAGLAAASRAWWLLGYAGIANVVMLDGGLGAWRAANLPLDQGEVKAELGDAVVHFGAKPVIDIAQAREWGTHGVLFDARAGERYRGEVEPMDFRAGHIPGATSAPTTENLTAQKHFKSAAELKERFTNLGLNTRTEIAVYCGSGITAAHEIAALEIAGFQAALFPGSWSAWSHNTYLPVALGTEKGSVEG